MSKEPFRLLIVDSVIAVVRMDFTGRGELAERQVSGNEPKDLRNRGLCLVQLSCTLKAELVAFVASGGDSYGTIVKGVLVEKEGAVVVQEGTTRLLLQSISPAL